MEGGTGLLVVVLWPDGVRGYGWGASLRVGPYGGSALRARCAAPPTPRAQALAAGPACPLLLARRAAGAGVFVGGGFGKWRLRGVRGIPVSAFCGPAARRAGLCGGRAAGAGVSVKNWLGSWRLRGVRGIPVSAFSGPAARRAAGAALLRGLFGGLS